MSLFVQRWLAQQWTLLVAVPQFVLIKHWSVHLSMCTSLQMLWYHTVLYPVITDISSLLALILKFLLLVNCFTEGVIFSNSHTTATEKMGQHNCQGDFNLVCRIILCRSPERHSSFPKCLLPVICLLSVIYSGSKSQYGFYFTIYDENFCVKGFFIQVTKIFIILLLFWSVHGDRIVIVH